jgi:hypothetical protein
LAEIYFLKKFPFNRTGIFLRKKSIITLILIGGAIMKHPCVFLRKECRTGGDGCEIPDEYQEKCGNWKPLAIELLKVNARLCPAAVFAGYTSAMCDKVEERKTFAEGKCYEGTTCLGMDMYRQKIARQ